MLIKNFTVTIRNNSTNLKPQSVVLYKGDFGLLLNIYIEGFRFKISSIGKIDATIVNKSTAKLTSMSDLRFTDDTILLPITSEGLVLNEAGTYQVQLHIFDPKYNRISMPSFDIICKEPIYTTK